MRYFWIIDKQKDGTLDVQWYPGKENLADYITKHHPPHVHKKLRPVYLHNEQSPRYIQRRIPMNFLRGCVETPIRTPVRTLVSNTRKSKDTQNTNVLH